jgi:Tol biopolymer transport system component
VFSATSPGERSPSLFVLDPAGALERLAGSPGDSDPSWSPDGTRLAFRRWVRQDCPRPHEDCAQIVVADADGRNARAITLPGHNSLQPDWAPDGTRLVFARWQDDANPFANSTDIYVVNSDGTGLRLLTHGPGDDASPAWSPDGTRIAFTSTRGGSYDVFVMRSDGSDLRRLTRTGKPEYAPAWSPDGERIAFQDGDGRLVVVDADGTDLRTVTRSFAGDGQPAWSPDGKRIAFLRRGISGDALYVVRDDGSDLRRLDIGDVLQPTDPDWAAAPGER